MTNKQRIKDEMQSILSRLKPGESIFRGVLWNRVFSNIDDNSFFSNHPRSSDRFMRKLIEEIKKQGLAVGSSTQRGYFIIHSQTDFDEAIHTYKSKIRGLSRTITQIKKNAEYKLGRELSEATFLAGLGAGHINTV